ncbi:MAG: transposase [Methanobacteriota archaeon]
MPPLPKCSDKDYIHFLMAAQCDASCVKAADCYSEIGINIAHDSFNRFLTRQSLTNEALWKEVEPYVEKMSGWFVLDDTVIDKIHSKFIEMTYYQWSGKHHGIVKGIGLISLVWTDGSFTYPLDYRLYDPEADEMTKNDHFREMINTAVNRGFKPNVVLFDSWYSGIENLKFLRNLGLNWFTRLKKNRQVNPERSGNVGVGTLTLPTDGMEVHLKKFGFIRVFHSVNPRGKDRYWATNILQMDYADRKNLQSICWTIENYHRTIKEICCLEKCPVRKRIAQKNHINCALRAYLRFEFEHSETGNSPYTIKWEIQKVGINTFLKGKIAR